MSFCFIKCFCDTWRQTVFFSGAAKSSAVPVPDRGWKFIPGYTFASVFGVASLRLGWLKGNFLLPSHQGP